MKILLDTHVFLWASLEPERLTVSMRKYLENGANDLVMNAASVWEIGTKYAMKKLDLAVAPEIFVPQQVGLLGIEVAPLRLEHALLAHQLPWHHRDPVDRMIIAQAVSERLAIMTTDSAFQSYGVRILE